MRIAFLAPSFQEAFGQERATQQTISLLKAGGHEVFPLALQEATQLHLLSSPKAVKETLNRLMQQLKDCRPDLVHFVEQFDFRILKAVSREYPSVLTAHTVAPTCPASHRMIYRQEVCPEKSGWKCLLYHHRYGCLRHFKNDLHRLNALQNYVLKRRALKEFRGFIAISKFVEDTLTRDGFDVQKVFQIYNAVSPLDPTPIPNPPKKLIVTASRLVELKGIEYTLRALKILEKEDWNFWILGDGPERARLEALTEDLGLKHRVNFKGHVGRDEVASIMKASLFVTQTNVGPEGFGLSVAEAQGMGKPVIGFNIPAINEIVVDGETGYLVPPRNIEELAEAIKKLLTDAALRLYFGSQAREQILRVFSEKNHYQKTVEAYEVCLSVKRKVPTKASMSFT